MNVEFFWRAPHYLRELSAISEGLITTERNGIYADHYFDGEPVARATLKELHEIGAVVCGFGQPPRMSPLGWLMLADWDGREWGTRVSSPR